MMPSAAEHRRYSDNKVQNAILELAFPQEGLTLMAIYRELRKIRAYRDINKSEVYQLGLAPLIQAKRLTVTGKKPGLVYRKDNVSKEESA